MDTFDKREEAFERAFALQEELRFKTRAWRNRKLGEWATEQLALSGQARQDFVENLCERQFQSPNDEALVAEIARALEPKISAHRIRRVLDEFGAEAAREIQAGR